MEVVRGGHYQRLGNGEPLDIMRPETQQHDDAKKPGGHPNVLVLLGALAIIGIGLLIVDSRSLTIPGDSSSSWVGLGSIIDGTPADPRTHAVRRIDLEPSILDQVTNSAPFVYIPPSGGPVQSVGTNAADAPDVEEILSLASPESRASWVPASAPAEPPSWAQAYSFIPTGMVSTTTRSTERTESQQRLYDYGNNIGSYIQDFEATHHNASQIATDQLADRGNVAKADALRRLGSDYTTLGKRLLDIEDVPTEAAALHRALALAYQGVGATTAKIADAVRDQELLDAVTAHNKAVDTLMPAYTALVTFFSLRSISFSPDDPGSAFSFKP